MASTTKTVPKRVTQAGVSLKSGVDNPNPLRHGSMGQAERAFSAASTLLSGVMAISASQFIGAPLKLIDAEFYEAYMARTKESFAVLMTTIRQWWAPTVVRVSGDHSMKGQLFQMDDGDLKCNFSHRLIMMGNHQLYTDWLYLWWIAYTNKMHGYIYIILKESLKNVPIMGWGMQFYNFIFLSRKWEQDRYKFKKHLDNLKNPQDPMWLLIFPEGTNLSAETREKSAGWAKKTGVPDMKHQLLPRKTGLQFCLQELRASTNWLYDCTIAYEGVPKGLYGQDVFTLKSSLFEGRPPKSVNMYFRRYRITEIPYQNEEQFERWLINRWREKDYILEYFYKFGNFPAEDPARAILAAEGKRKPVPVKAISTSVRGGGWDEFLSIFGPINTAAEALSSVDFTEPINFDELMHKVAQSQQFNLLKIGEVPTGAAGEETIRRALLAANQTNPLPNTVLDRLLKSPPKTPVQMRQVLQKAGDPRLAKQVASTPTAQPSVPPVQYVEATKAVSRGAQTVNASMPANTIRSEVPLASMKSMITKPLTTTAVHKAGANIKNMAAERAKTQGAALPSQALPASQTAGTSTATASKPPNSVTKPSVKLMNRVNGKVKLPSTKGASVSGKAPSKKVTPQQLSTTKAASVQGAPTAAVKNSSSKTFTLTEEGRKKLRAANSKPVGTQKYLNGNAT